eukprot:scaffold62912_cov65-Phaeocystis_antarctica.AAC.4
MSGCVQLQVSFRAAVAFGCCRGELMRYSKEDGFAFRSRAGAQGANTGHGDLCEKSTRDLCEKSTT